VSRVVDSATFVRAPAPRADGPFHGEDVDEALVLRSISMTTDPTDTLSPAAAGLIGRLERRARRGLVRLRGQQVVAILGMHRSGTSSLAGSLEQAGLYLGGKDVAGKGEWNAKGNRESKVLMRLHERLLEANGGSWQQPPAQVRWDAEQRGARDRFIRSRATRRRWGFKDPRTILVIDGWLEAIPDLVMVATIRHPVAVARSLQKRAAGGTLDDWLRLWLDYDERLLRLYQARPFPIIDFDLPAERYQRRLGAVIAELGLRQPTQAQPFFEPSLRSDGQPGLELPAPVTAVYQQLCAIAAEQADA
jgi:hypothetical protein